MIFWDSSTFTTPFTSRDTDKDNELYQMSMEKVNGAIKPLSNRNTQYNTIKNVKDLALSLVEEISISDCVYLPVVLTYNRIIVLGITS